MQENFMSNNFLKTGEQLEPPVGSESFPASEPTDISGPTKSEFDLLKNIIYAILVIVALGFISLLITSFDERKASYEQLLEKVNTLQVEVHVLSEGKF
jgi:hypothetical protein